MKMLLKDRENEACSTCSWDRKCFFFSQSQTKWKKIVDEWVRLAQIRKGLDQGQVYSNT